MKKYLLLFALLPALAACNTMEGLGQDIQRGGASLERSAQQNR
jgi:predicted small secreted protein